MRFFNRSKYNNRILISILTGIGYFLFVSVSQQAIAQKNENPEGGSGINEFHYWVYSCPEQNQQPVKTGFNAMASLERLPHLFPSGTQTKQFIAYDASGVNSDGDFLNSFTKYIDQNGEHVIFDDYGPGTLYRQQINIWWDNRPNKDSSWWVPPGKSRIKYYFDGEDTPRIDCTVDELFRSNEHQFVSPFCFSDKKNRFAIAYTPLNFLKRLKVTIKPVCNWDDRWTTWYQYTYLSHPSLVFVDGFSRDDYYSKEIADKWANVGNDPKDTIGNIRLNYNLSVSQGDSAEIFLDNPGSVAALKLKMEPYNQELFYNVQMKVHWDNHPEAAIDVPLGYFFGGGGKNFPIIDAKTEKEIDISAYSLKNLLYGFNGAEHYFYSYWPMPFGENARVRFVNHSGLSIKEIDCQIDFKPRAVYDYDMQQSGYFHAKSTLDTAWGEKPFAVAFEESGRGHVVGISFYTKNYDMDGDQFTYIDDSQTPQIHGNGTEDDHNQGWGGDAYQFPLWGALINGFSGAYRLFLNDAYIFNKNIKIRYEYEKIGEFLDTKTDVTVFYYKSPGSGMLKLTDQLDVGNASSENQHDYRIEGEIWTGKKFTYYDGYSTDIAYDRCEDDGRAFNKKSSFTVKIDSLNNGALLRKRIYRTGNGIQKAWVYVDGKKVERPWYIVTPSSAPEIQIVRDSTKKVMIIPSELENQGWYESDFTIPVEYTKQKNRLNIEIVYDPDITN
jgi:hypothetical protein